MRARDLGRFEDFSFMPDSKMPVASLAELPLAVSNSAVGSADEAVALSKMAVSTVSGRLAGFASPVSNAVSSGAPGRCVLPLSMSVVLSRWLACPGGWLGGALNCVDSS